MKLYFEVSQGSDLPVKSVMVEREDMPWDSQQKCDEAQSFKTAVKVALAYHQLTSHDPSMISRNELMSYLGYGPQSAKTTAYERLPDVLREIGCICDGFGMARPGVRLGYKLDLEIVKTDRPLLKGERKEYLKKYAPFVLLSLDQILELIKLGKSSKGSKFNEYLRVYLLVRRNMKTCYDDNKCYLGMYGMLPQSQLREAVGLSDKTIIGMTNAMEQARLVCKLSGRKVGEDVYGINCYASSRDPRLVDVVRKAQIEKGVKKKQFVAARKGHGSSILDHSITDALGVTDFQV